MRHTGVRTLTLAVAAALLATTNGFSITTAQAQQQAGHFLFNIPAKPVPQAVNDIARVSGLSVVFRESRPISATGNPVNGAMSAEQALTAVLAGTGFGYSFSNPTTVQIFEVMAGTPSGTTQLDTIRIFGSRSANTLESSSASVGIVTAKDIDQGQIRTFRDTFRRLANVQDSAYVSSGFVIRGMSSEGFSPAGAPVGSLYIDGVLQTRVNARRAQRSAWDMEQVEVYRGPQSTLSGRAAMSGAIYLKSKDPTFERAAEISATAGSNRMRGTAFMLNTPLVDDQLAMRIAGSYERSRSPSSFPTYEHFSRFGEYTTDLSYNIRGKLLFTPTALPDTTALLSYSFGKEDPVDRFIGVGPDFGLDDNRGDFYRWPAHAEYRPIKTHNAGLEIKHGLSDKLTLTSQTGLTHGASRRASVDLGTPGVSTGYDGTIDDTLFSQEFRLNYEGDRWQWVAGLYGSHQNTDTELDISLPTGVVQRQVTSGKTVNLALFGEASYAFAPGWRATLGGRVDYLRLKENQFAAQRQGLQSISRENSARISETNFVPKVGLSKELSPGHTVGATYTKGFRTGGYYVNLVTLEPASYDPEHADSYELFYKGRLLDDRLTLNANLFYTKYTDQQIEVRPAAGSGASRETHNAGSSRAWGFEIEPTWQVNDRFSAFASIGYLNAKFIQFNHASYDDLSGKPWPEAPEWSIGLGAHYAFGNGFYVGGDAKYTSSYQSTLGIAPQDKIDSRFIVNAQAGYRTRQWEINAYVDNLFDQVYYTGMDMHAAPAYAQIGQRRTVGVNLRARF